MSNPLLSAANAWHAAGLSIVPARTDGSKAPAAFWKKYQSERPTSEQVETWFGGGDYDGLGAVTGAISGNLEMLELEGHASELAPNIGSTLRDNGFADLWNRITGGYLEKSPSGGYHWLYRIGDGPAAPNTKLARRPATEQELATNPHDKIKVLIETRGEGGFTILAPSAGRTHPTGRPWTTISGTPDSIPTITVAERDILFAVCSSFDQMPHHELEHHHPPAGSPDRVRPGDDYNARASWDDLLPGHGWTKTARLGKGYGWTRPGKDPREGISATTGQNDADNLFVFTTASELPDSQPLSKFAVYTLLEHAGRYADAAKELRRLGYGDPLEPTQDVPPFQGLVDGDGFDGNLATVTALPAPPRRHLAPVAERTLTRSDDANALALIDRYGDYIRFVHDRGRWIAWDGTRWDWCPPGGGAVREYAKRVARSLPDTDQADINHKKKSLSANGTTAMIQQAQTDDRILIGMGALDAHPLELNTPGGILNLATGQLEPSRPERLHTRMTATAPDPNQPTPRWNQFLADTFAGHEDVLPFLQELAGYSLTGSVTHHVLPFLHGPGGNGKSVFLDVLRHILGDYAGSTPAKFLMSNSQQHETEIARLSGLRLVIASEVNQDDKFDEAKVKLLTGGDALTARFMRQDHFTFTPTHHLWLMGNHQPKVSAGGESFWRRLRLIPFSNIVPDEKKIENLDRLLIEEEGPGILSWAIQGAVRVIRDGMRAPESVMAATSTYASEEDILARFLADRCIVTGNQAARIDTADLRAAYARWCEGEGERPLSPQVFGRELRSRFGIEQGKSNGRRIYVGIMLLATDDAEDNERWWEK